MPETKSVSELFGFDDELNVEVSPLTGPKTSAPADNEPLPEGTSPDPEEPAEVDDTEESAAGTEDKEPAEEKVYVREIDIGDGSGIQRFEAGTPEDLADLLATAQTNATRKIRELNQRVKRLARRRSSTTTVPASSDAVLQTIRPISATEEAELILEMQVNPAKAVKRFVEAQVGLTADEFRRTAEEVRSIKSALAEQTVANEFLLNNEDYVASPKNFRALREYLETEGLDFTLDNLQSAFDDLKEEGTIAVTSDEPAKPVEPKVQVVKKPVAARIETQPAKSAAPKKSVEPAKVKQSGLSAKKTQAEPKTAIPTDDDLAKLTLEEHRDRIVALHQQLKKSGVPQR